MDHPEELLTAMSALTNDDRYIKEYFAVKGKKEEYKMCDLFDQAERRGEERTAYKTHVALYQSAVLAFKHGSNMEYVKSIFPSLSHEDLKKAMEESKLSQ